MKLLQYLLFVDRLEQLLLGTNKFPAVPDWIGNLTSLRAIYLNNLGFKYTQDFTLYSFTNVPLVALRNNAFHCEKQMCWMKRRASDGYMN